MPPAWICCQLGAREHFAVPRALHQAGRLALLVTDSWVPPDRWLARLPAAAVARLRQRFHPDLASAAVRAFPTAALRFEIVQQLRARGGWERIIARNEWFQKRAVHALEGIRQTPGQPLTVFAYSYAARDILRHARSRGWRTVLGQIDPGPVEEELVASQHRSLRLADWHPAPARYWRTWREECELADCIMVNSGWSSRALQQAGIDEEKIAVVPLAYDPPAAAREHVRLYPDAFSRERPLRVLFLGQIIVRKGIGALLAAAKLLETQPVEFWLVGSSELGALPDRPNLRWVGPVSRHETARFYRDADVFLFPTISDGFGLTQLEAQAWRLPVIASRRCGEVVRDRVNGLVLAEVTSDAIASVLTECLRRPRMLAALAQEAGRIVDQFTLARLERELEGLDRHGSSHQGVRASAAAIERRHRKLA